MTIPEFESVASALGDLVQSGALVVAGYWTYRRFILTREDKSKIDASANFEVMGEHNGARLGVVTATISNSGKVRHKIMGMHFDLRVLQNYHALQTAQHRMGYVDFPEKLYSEQPLFPPEWKWSFVEPGATNHYRYSVILPPDVKFVLVKLKVFLPGEDQFFSSWRIFNVGQTPPLP